MATETPNYAINYEDDRLTNVEQKKEAALSDIENTYGGMINESDSFYNTLAQNTKDWEAKQTQLQQENTDFAIQKIEQDKAQAEKDYTKEQAAAYQDYQKQSNKYGVNAEQMAANGLTGTGFSESSQVAMYNQYQNRVATARESFNQVVMNYNNSITEARLQNNSALAEIAYQSLQQQAEYALQGFQYKNNLVLDQMNKKLEVENMYHSQYMDVLNQMNTENQLAENVRQFTLNHQLEVEQFNESKAQWQKEYELENKKFQETIRQFEVEMARLKERDKVEDKQKAEELALAKKEYQLAYDKWLNDKENEKKQLELAERELELKEKQYKKSSVTASETLGRVRAAIQGSKNVAKGSPATVKGTSQSGSTAKIDQTSLKNIGNPTPQQLIQKVQSGAVLVSKVGNTFYVRNNPTATKMKALLY